MQSILRSKQNSWKWLVSTPPHTLASFPEQLDTNLYYCIDHLFLGKTCAKIWQLQFSTKKIYTCDSEHCHVYTEECKCATPFVLLYFSIAHHVHRSRKTQCEMTIRAPIRCHNTTAALLLKHLLGAVSGNTAISAPLVFSVGKHCGTDGVAFNL